MGDLVVSGKRWENIGSYCLRQHRAGSHCNRLHGYSPSIEVEFITNTPDVRGWVVDFGSLGSFKHQLEDMFDHTVLVATDDPEKRFYLDDLAAIAKVVEVPSTSAEGLAKFIYELLNGQPGYTSTGWLYVNGYQHVRCSKVKFEEKPGNFAIYQG